MFSLAGRDKKEPDVRRIARLPELEREYLALREAADALAEAVLVVQAYRAQCANGSTNLTALATAMKGVEGPLAAYRKATG